MVVAAEGHIGSSGWSLPGRQMLPLLLLLLLDTLTAAVCWTSETHGGGRALLDWLPTEEPIVHTRCHFKAQ